MRTGSDLLETTALTWERGDGHPVLEEGAVHVWHARLDPPLDVLCAALSRDERARAETIMGVQTRRRWRRSRGVMRAVLALYLEQTPRELRFVVGADGKPRLAAEEERLHFSLSHSADRALLALSRTQAVGVDIELDRRELNELALAQRAFGPRERERLQALEPAARRSELLRAWTRREAALKVGGGPTCPEGPSPWVIDLDLGAAGAAALALGAVPEALHCWEWAPESDPH